MPSLPIAFKTHSPAGQAGRGRWNVFGFFPFAHKTDSPARQAGRGRLPHFALWLPIMKHLTIALFLLSFTPPLHGAVQTKVIEYKQGDQVLEGYLAWDDALTGTRPGVLVGGHEGVFCRDFQGRVTASAVQGPFGVRWLATAFHCGRGLQSIRISCFGSLRKPSMRLAAIRGSAFLGLQTSGQFGYTEETVTDAGPEARSTSEV